MCRLTRQFHCHLIISPSRDNSSAMCSIDFYVNYANAEGHQLQYLPFVKSPNLHIANPLLFQTLVHYELLKLDY